MAAVSPVLLEVPVAAYASTTAAVAGTGMVPRGGGAHDSASVSSSTVLGERHVISQAERHFENHCKSVRKDMDSNHTSFFGHRNNRDHT
jgi:hypothetical protein